MREENEQRPLKSGVIIADSYQVIDLLGVGSFGITYRALDLDLDMLVAIKEYCPRFALRHGKTQQLSPASQSFSGEYQIGLSRFILEAKTLAKFKHHNIVRVLGYKKANNTAYMVMDFEEGDTLDHFLQSHSPLSYQTCIEIFIPLMDGLRAMHDVKKLHLDIKPDNIFLRAKSTPCLIDFGGARVDASRESRLVDMASKASFLVVADGYSPPEQYAFDVKKHGAWTDIYALGSTLYEAISGRSMPISTARTAALSDEEADPKLPLKDLVTGYPAEFIEAIEDCVKLARAKRPQNIRELQQRLMDAGRKSPDVGWVEEKKETIVAAKPKSVVKREKIEKTVAAKIARVKPKQKIKQKKSKFKVWVAVLLLLSVSIWLAVQFWDLRSNDIRQMILGKPEYQKISSQGKKLSESATAWHCVLDNNSGLMWEVKTRDGGLRDRNHEYTWYNSDASSNGGNAGVKNEQSDCQGTVCNTQAYEQAVNRQGLCGYKDWRLPKKAALLSIMDSQYSQSQYIDSRYFPNMRDDYNWFWSASSYAADSERAWGVDFLNGNDYDDPKSGVYQVRLVRGGQ